MINPTKNATRRNRKPKKSNAMVLTSHQLGVLSYAQDQLAAWFISPLLYLAFSG